MHPDQGRPARAGPRRLGLQIPYNGDFRPYFTIHDPDFKAFVNKARVRDAVTACALSRGTTRS